MKAHEEFLSWNELHDELEKLNLALQACDTQLLMNALKSLVPGYHSNGDSVDLNAVNDLSMTQMP
jgi:hypothetical protein